MIIVLKPLSPKEDIERVEKYGQSKEVWTLT